MTLGHSEPRTRLKSSGRGFRVGIAILASALVLSGCGSSASEIRVRNLNGFLLEDVTVLGTSFGDIEPGATTDFRLVAEIFVDVTYTATGRGRKFEVVAADRDEAETRDNGRYTYEITLLDREGGSVLAVVPVD